MRVRLVCRAYVGFGFTPAALPMMIVFAAIERIRALLMFWSSMLRQRGRHRRTPEERWQTPAMTGGSDEPINLRIGPEELVIRQRYEVASIVNDILVAAWFITGSILFFSSADTRLGTWMFLLGSVELLVRPVIRLSRRIHLQRIGAVPRTGTTGQEF